MVLYSILIIKLSYICTKMSFSKNITRVWQGILILLFVALVPLQMSAKARQQLWVIDAGHGGYDVGCEGSKTKEKFITLSVARRVAELVRGSVSGVKVRLTRDSDCFLSLQQRADIANQAGADLFLSIHVNSAPEASFVRGTETYYGPVGATNISVVERARRDYAVRSELLAWCMQKQYGLVGRPISRGVKRERYYVVLHTLMPSILTEIGFLSNASDQNYMMSAAGQEEIAQCIYRGLVDYKDYVDRGREKRTLAQMRQTGGRPSNEEMLAFVEKNKSQRTLESVSTKVEKPVESSVVSNSDTKSKPTVATNNVELKKSDVAYNGPQKKPDLVINATQNKSDVADISTQLKPVDSNPASQNVVSAIEQKKDDAVILDPSLEPEFETGELRFNVQIFALKTKIPVDDSRLKGLKDVQIMEKDDRYKYLCGSTSDYVEARRILEEVRRLFPDAFLVAFLGKRQISTADAQEIYVGKN